MASGIDPLASSAVNVTNTGVDLTQPVVAAGLLSTPSLPESSSAIPATEERFTKTIRVLHVVNGEHFAGAERVQSHLGRCLPKYGVRADFACVKPGRFADAVDGAESKWGVAHRLPMQHRFDLSVVKRIAQTARTGGYDLLHAHTPRTAMITAIVARMTKLPWVYHVHSPAARDSCKRMVNSINAWIERRSLNSCDHLITVSESLRNDCILAGYHPTRVTVVHNGVPAICYDRSETPRPGGRWVLGMVALMRPRKGLEVAIDALSRLRAVDHDVILRCIGPFETEEYRHDINRQIADLKLGDRIEQVGFQSDVPLALSKLDAMLLPSLYGEGLPMVVLEAMAAGLPVVATAVEGTPEAIRDGIDGLLAEPASATDLAFKIEHMVTGKFDWNACAKSARVRHAESFSDWAMSRGVANIYRKVILNH
ncbi:MAG TPA: glycosyltransferase family 1 protein [Planctomycetaceae bacterium]|nr:glycosyltransferase family 1 protein [Planctomycetaceae bacterium]